MLYGFRRGRQNASFVIRQDIFWHDHLSPSHGRSTAEISAARRRYQLDFLRLGGAALFHADHHLRIRALFRYPCGVRSGQRTGLVGLCHRGGRVADRAVVPGARRHRRRQRPPQAMDRRVRGAIGDRLLPDVVRQARRPQRDSAAAAGLRDRDHRRRIRHRLQQCDDADAGAAGSDRTTVRHRMGHRLCRRHRQSDPGARLSRRGSCKRAHAVRFYAAVRSRSPDTSGRPHQRTIDRHLVHRFRAADVLADAGLSRQASAARCGARGTERTAAGLARIAEAEIAGGVSARQHDLYRRAGVAVRIRRYLCRRHLRLADASDRQLRYSAGRSPAPLARGSAAGSTMRSARNV